MSAADQGPGTGQTLWHGRFEGGPAGCPPLNPPVVVLDSMETVQVAVRTADTPSASPLMFHCHILEHEDQGMMATLRVVG